MEVFSIGTAQPMAAVRADLEHEMGLLHSQGLPVRVLEEKRGVYSFVECEFDQAVAGDGENQARILRYYVANVITDIIMNTLTKEILARMIRGRHGYFSEDERQEVLREAVALLNAQAPRGEIPHRIFRRNEILSRVLRYLEHHNHLVLEGFVRFQLKDYFTELKEAVDCSIDRHMLQREYHEFIRMLRNFVEMQSPRIDEVNVRVKGGSMFSLLDEEGEPIEHEQLRSVLTDLGPEEIDYEDLLLSALITIAPARVVLHILEPLEVVDTIKLVFCERVMICPGCPVCREERPF